MGVDHALALGALFHSADEGKPFPGLADRNEGGGQLHGYRGLPAIGSADA